MKNSKEQNNSSFTGKEEPDKNVDDGGVSGAAVAVTAVAGAAALAVWGLSKLFGSSKPEENNMMMASTGSFKLEAIDDDKWTKPEYGWFKLNTDASAFPDSTSKAAAGGLIRDHTGRWIVGFTANLETRDITLAELHAVREGLKLAWNRGLKKVIIETDSQASVNLIKNPKWNSENHPLGFILEECRNLMMKISDWNIDLNHIYRSKNRCANAMAKMAKNQSEELIIWKETPANVQTLLFADMYD